jgi:two-component system NarL family response regulator
MIRILLVDDHKMMREALRLMLEQDGRMKVVAEVGDGETALRMAKDLAPDVVVMDVTLPGQSGIEVTQRLLARHPQIKVIGLSTHLERGIIRQMLDAGALGYVAKAAAGAELEQGIRSVFEGKRFLSLDVVALMTDSLRSRQAGARNTGNSRLTSRELQVTALLAKGRSTPEIAAELHISPGTVNTHRGNLMKKLEVHNVADVTRYAIRTGLVSS